MASSVVFRILLYERVTAVELLGGQNRVITLENLITCLCQSSRLVNTLCSLLKINLDSLHGDINNSNNHGLLYRRKYNDEQERKLAEMVWNIGAKRQSSCLVGTLIDNVHQYSVTNIASFTGKKDISDSADDYEETDTTNTLPVYRVLYDFVAEGPGELTITKDTLVIGVPWDHLLDFQEQMHQENNNGSYINLSTPPPEGWLLCIHIKSAISNIQETGYLPLSYLQLVDQELNDDSLDYLKSPPSVSRIVKSNDATKYINAPTISPVTTVVESLKSWVNNPVKEETTSRPGIVTKTATDSTKYPSIASSFSSLHSNESFVTKTLHFPSSTPSTSLFSPTLSKPVVLSGTNPIPKAPGPLTTRKQIITEVQQELDDIRSGKFLEIFSIPHYELTDAQTNLQLDDLDSGNPIPKRRPPPPTPSYPPSSVSTLSSPSYRRSAYSTNHKENLLNSPLMKPFRGTSTETDVLNSIKIVRYDFNALGSGELSVKEGDYVLPFPDQSECAPGWTLVFHVPLKQESTTKYSVGYVPTVYLVPMNSFSGDNNSNNYNDNLVVNEHRSPEQIPGKTEELPAVVVKEEKTAEDELSILLNVVLPSTRMAEANRNKAEQEANAYVQGYGDAIDRLRIELDLSMKEMTEKISKLKESIRLTSTPNYSNTTEVSLSSSWLYKSGTKNNNYNSILTKLYAELHDIENDRTVVQRQIEMLTNLEKQHKEIFSTRLSKQQVENDSQISSTDTLPYLLRPTLPTDESYPSYSSNKHNSKSIGGENYSGLLPSSHLSVPKNPAASSLSLSSSSTAPVRRRAPPLPPVMAQFQQLEHTDRRINDFTNHVKLMKPPTGSAGSSSFFATSSTSSIGSSSSLLGVNKAWNPALTPAASSAPSLSSNNASFVNHITPRSTVGPGSYGMNNNASSLSLSSVYPSFLTNSNYSHNLNNPNQRGDKYYSSSSSSSSSNLLGTTSSSSSSMVNSRTSSIIMATPKHFVSTPQIDPSLVVARIEPK